MRAPSFAALIISLTSPAALLGDGTAPPRLVVVLAVDQLCADYLPRFRPYFAEGGFKRLLDGGADFQNCHFRHALTKTAPGHATILTGTHANTNGIAGNEWLDHDSWQMVESVEDPAFPLVGAPERAGRSPGGVIEARTGRSPAALLATTVGDRLKQHFGAQSKVFSVSNKDRAAILLGGKLADSAYWIDDGRFVTSRYYRPKLPAWIEAFNASGRVDAMYGKTWDRLLAPAVYDAVQGPDNAPGEAAGSGFGPTFPKKLDGGHPDKLTPTFYSAFGLSPFATTILGEFAETAIREEKLGHHEATDLLCVSFSQIDAAGHAYGPDSHEIMDSMLRLDRVLASLLATLEHEVGLAHCMIVLTADHGVCPLPERFKPQHPETAASRFDRTILDASVIAALDSAFGPVPSDTRWFFRDNFGYVFAPAALKAKNLPVARAAIVVRDALLKSPQIVRAFTREEMLALKADDDSLEAMCRRSFHPLRGADVVYLTVPYIVDRSGSGTSHGTPHDYDTHVPQLWYGPGVPVGTHAERVAVEDIAPTLAGLLGLTLPPEARGRRLF